MEFRDAIRLYLRRRWLAFGLIVLVVAGTFAWQALQPVQYQTSMSISVNRVNQDKTPDYQYDGYYALQAADLFSQTIVSWLQTPSILVSIYEQAGLSTDVRSTRQLTSRFQTKKASAQNVVVTYTSSSKEEAQKLASAITDVTQKLAENANRDADNKALFELDVAKPVIVQAQSDPVLTGALSVFVGFVLSLFLVPFAAYLSEAKS